MRKTRTRVAAVVATGALSLVGAAPAAAAPQQEGLVNVNVSDLVVQVPVGVAANICNVPVSVLSENVRAGNNTCDSVAGAGDTFAWNAGRGGGSPQQEGLVNVNVSDIVIQAPISVAANVCNVPVSVLARNVRADDNECDADAGSGDTVAFQPRKGGGRA